jgi:hypothetical protein
MKILLMLAGLLALQDDGVSKILEKHKAARPADKDLLFVRHDWEPSYEKAKARAAKEGRPVFLVVISNLNGYDNLYTGHC